jgi:hypothetical protein
MEYHPYEKIAFDEVEQLFNTIFVNFQSIEEVVSEFRNTVICPPNPDVFTEDDFSPHNTDMIIF